MKDFILNNGNKIPDLAYGTWLIKNENAEQCVLTALDIGYRHIDTAQAYGNEVGVGLGIKHSGLKREEIYVTAVKKNLFPLKHQKNQKLKADKLLRQLAIYQLLVHIAIMAKAIIPTMSLASSVMA